MAYTLHYAPLISREITEIKSNVYNDIVNIIGSIFDDKIIHNTVYIFSWDEPDSCNFEDDILVTDNSNLISDLLDMMALSMYDLTECDTFYLQEYRSFEEAYSVALAMREPKDNCYENEYDKLN